MDVIFGGHQLTWGEQANLNMILVQPMASRFNPETGEFEETELWKSLKDAFEHPEKYPNEAELRAQGYHPVTHHGFLWVKD